MTNTVICDKCFNTKNFDNNSNCECGGKFYSIDNFEWIEDQPDLIFTNDNWINEYKIMKNEA
ncbi:hypothetical protein [Saccharicrinis sp. FJH54]|uniref:hypothetical protein n=1 Tax=Saccharicrinis sp. FJH54 TaxID=3344665 RepID=UPI0035D45B5C